MEEMIKIPKEEYEKLKMQANVDIELLKQFIESFKDIKEGKIRKVYPIEQVAKELGVTLK